MPPKQTTDVLIIGAGVIGLSLAWELARRGIRAAILERGEVGRAASWAGAGMIPPRINAHPFTDHAAPLQALLDLCRELHPRWAEELRAAADIDNEYRRCGAWYLAADAGETAALREQHDTWHSAGTAVEWHSREQLPPQFGSAWEAGFFAADEAQIRNPRHLRALHAAVLARGVPIETNSEPRSIVRQGNRSVGVLTDNAHWSAAHVCLCSGAWSGTLGELLGLKIPVQPVRGQILLLDSRETIPSILNHGHRYIVPRRDGLTLVGSTEEDVGFVNENTAEGLAELRAFANQALPSLAAAETRQSWAGLRPASARPWLSQIPGWDNAWIAAGHYRHGLTLSPGTAKVMAALICGEPAPVDPTWFKLASET